MSQEGDWIWWKEREGRWSKNAAGEIERVVDEGDDEDEDEDENTLDSGVDVGGEEEYGAPGDDQGESHQDEEEGSGFGAKPLLGLVFRMGVDEDGNGVSFVHGSFEIISTARLTQLT